MGEPTLSRRRFCKLVASTVALFPFGTAVASTGPDRRLRLYNCHTDERIDIRYCSGGIYDRGALDELNHFLRCHYTNDIPNMDVGVMDVLADILREVGDGRTAEVISGYRSPVYNEHLRRKGRAVAKNSLHIKGLAIDFAVPGHPSRQLARVARTAGAGGVGTYPEFVHIDTGRVRSW
jgi:uncharacterized protein YcbK (DUF882 family)